MLGKILDTKIVKSAAPVKELLIKERIT